MMSDADEAAAKAAREEYDREFKSRLLGEWQQIANRFKVASLAFETGGPLGSLPDLLGPVRQSCDLLMTVAPHMPDLILPPVMAGGEFVEAALDAVVKSQGEVPDDLSSLLGPDDPEET